MNLKLIKSISLISGVLLMSSCSHRMVGKWTVQRYETSTPGKQNFSMSNIGTMQFNSNGSGEKNLQYSVFGQNRNDQLPFKWSWKEGKYVIIESSGSDLSKTWIIIDNKRRFQKWKSTDGNNTVQIIELKK